MHTFIFRHLQENYYANEYPEESSVESDSDDGDEYQNVGLIIDDDDDDDDEDDDDDDDHNFHHFLDDDDEENHDADDESDTM